MEGRERYFRDQFPVTFSLTKIQLAIQISIEEFGEYLICSS